MGKFTPQIQTRVVRFSSPLYGGLLPDGNVNQELVKQGCWWWYRKNASGDTVLEGLEQEARETKKGFGAAPHPVPPWEWRKRSR
jgi:endonuclease YncB( thermonuclease family)